MLDIAKSMTSVAGLDGIGLVVIMMIRSAASTEGESSKFINNKRKTYLSNKKWNYYLNNFQTSPFLPKLVASNSSWSWDCSVDWLLSFSIYFFIPSSNITSIRWLVHFVSGLSLTLPLLLLFSLSLSSDFTLLPDICLEYSYNSRAS